MATAPKLPLDLADAVIAVLADALALPAATAAGMTRETPLFGALPELDSMAVATVLTAIEDRFGFHIDDDEVDGELFATVGSLAAFVERRATR